MNLEERDRRLAEVLRRRRQTAALYERRRRAHKALTLLWFALAVLVGFALVAVVSASSASGQGRPLHPLASAALRWQPLTRATPERLDLLSRAAEGACRTMYRPLPDAARCPALILALAFHESSWDPLATGARHEIGLMQLLPGVATAGWPLRDLSDPATNILAGARHLDHAALSCALTSNRRLAERTLSQYAGIGCRPSRTASLVLRWAEELYALSIDGGRS
jgi:soluble lytic murein transglycosylase-like protein